MITTITGRRTHSFPFLARAYAWVPPTSSASFTTTIRRQEQRKQQQEHFVSKQQIRRSFTSDGNIAAITGNRLYRNQHEVTTAAEATGIRAASTTSPCLPIQQQQLQQQQQQQHSSQQTEAVPPKNFIPFPFAYHQELVVRVHALTNLGVGICRTIVVPDEAMLGSNEYAKHDINQTHHQQSRKRRLGRRFRKKKNEAPPNYGDREDMIALNENNSNNNHVDDVTTADADIGLSSYNNDSNNTNTWVIMVPRVIPGELVRLSIVRNHATYSEADLIEVIESSPHRVDSADIVCPLFEQGCAGCQYQHVTIAQQRYYKQYHVKDALIRIGQLDKDLVNALVQPTLGTEHVWQYRTKLTPHYDQLKPEPSLESSSSTTTTSSTIFPPIGFQLVNNQRRILDVPSCPIATPAINEKLTVVRRQMHQSFLDNGGRWPTKMGATLLFRQGDPDGPVKTQYKDYVTTTVLNGVKFRFKAGNFFQNNPYMVPVMVQQVIDAAIQPPRTNQQQQDGGDDGTNESHHNHHTTKMTHLIDCYCGSGLFAVSCAPFLERCIGIEVNENAVMEARANVHLNLTADHPCDFVAASAERIFSAPMVDDFPRDTTCVVMDPPRKGCSKEFLQQLLEYEPQRIIYVSCDPATQARDVQFILTESAATAAAAATTTTAAAAAAGGTTRTTTSKKQYEITKIQPMDLFPQTRHIECLIVLEAKPKRH